MGKRYRYGLSGRDAAHRAAMAEAGIVTRPRFNWHARRFPVLTATRVRYLERWFARTVERSRAYWAERRRARAE